MSGTFETLHQTTFDLFDRSTCSLESECGPEPYETPESRTTRLCGPQVFPASLSARQAKEMGLTTSGTYGPTASGSLRTAALSASTASRLRPKTDLLGSTLFSLTWKRRVTPLGRTIYALRATALLTSAKGCTGVRSPAASDCEGGVMDIQLAEREGFNPKIKLRDEAALFSPVPTPKAQNANSPGEHGQGGRDLQTDCQEFSPVPTPMANKNTPQQRDDFTPTLANVAEQFSPVPTPQAMDVRGDTREAHERTPEANKGGCSNLREQVQNFATDTGKTPNGSSAGTESTGQLNPCYSRFLMSLPVEWDFAAFRASENLKARKSTSRSSTKAKQGRTGLEDTETPSSQNAPPSS